ncbi:MAG: Rne/Rng family ribonuclease [Bacteroidia bacterium]|nr:Rne/Rng family ribonuclease [Bacteroidia bacterium]
MNKELIINSTNNKVEIALLEDRKLVELHQQKSDNKFLVGDIYLGRIKKLMPGLNAAFVDIGHSKDAFLHYTDLGPNLRSVVKFTNDAINGKSNIHLLDKFNFEPEIIKTGKINEVLSKKELILVQILKEPISTKGPRLTCELTIAGRHMVLTPFNNVIAISKKISSNEERKRLKNLIESIKPKNFGIIVRTAAEGKKVAELHEEMEVMLNKWKTIFSKLKVASPPSKILSELDKTTSILRDVLTDSFNRIIINDKEMMINAKNYLSQISADQINILTYHRSKKPVFDVYGITKQIKSSFGKTATMSSGAYLVIEHTEAMHVIDVNSGHKLVQGDQAETALKVNMEAAVEIARQMRLRDIGGIIIIDYIDMRNTDHKKLLLTTMRDQMKKDRAQHTILPLSKFGLMQITRQRVKPQLNINTLEVCPACKGTGKVSPTILIDENIERDLTNIYQSRPKSKITLVVHPYLEAFINKGIPSKRWRWYFKFNKMVKIVVDNNIGLTDYKFYDGNQDEIRLS